MKNDPLEIHDLCDNIKYADKKRELFDALIKLQEEMDDTLNLQDLYSIISIK